MNPQALTLETIRHALTCGLAGCACGTPHGLKHCPGHEDKNPSLQVSQNNGKILVKCHAGCSQDRVIEGLKARGLWPSRNGDRSETQRQGLTLENLALDAALVAVEGGGR